MCDLETSTSGGNTLVHHPVGFRALLGGRDWIQALVPEYTLSSLPESN